MSTEGVTTQIADILKFLDNGIQDDDVINTGEDDATFLILVGEGNTGKSTALNFALAEYERSNEEHRPIVIWNACERPQFMKLSELQTGLGVKIIIIQWKSDVFTEYLKVNYRTKIIEFNTKF